MTTDQANSEQRTDRRYHTGPGQPSPRRRSQVGERQPQEKQVQEELQSIGLELLGHSHRVRVNRQNEQPEQTHEPRQTRPPAHDEKGGKAEDPCEEGQGADDGLGAPKVDQPPADPGVAERAVVFRSAFGDEGRPHRLIPPELDAPEVPDESQSDAHRDHEQRRSEEEAGTLLDREHTGERGRQPGSGDSAAAHRGSVGVVPDIGDRAREILDAASIGSSL